MTANNNCNALNAKTGSSIDYFNFNQKRNNVVVVCYSNRKCNLSFVIVLNCQRDDVDEPPRGVPKETIMPRMFTV